jgi:acetyl esterase/lipase
MSREILSRPPIPADRRIPYGRGPSQFFDLFLPKLPAKQLAIMIHGGYWRPAFDLTHASHLCWGLAKTGIAAASLEYRRAGEGGGGWPATFDDVVAGFHAVRKQMNPLPDPVVLGHSAGGQLALRLAAQVGDIACVVALAPVACLVLAAKENLGSGAVAAFLGGPPDRIPQVYAAADPAQHASSVPRVLIHGTGDDVVPISISRAFVVARKGDSGAVKLIEIDGADHFDLIDPTSKAWPIVLAAAKQAFLK